jgi:putative glutamine amidotransferase
MHLPLPLVLFPCDYRQIGHHPFHTVGDKYVAAARDIGQVMPLLAPGGAPHLIDGYLDAAQGLLSTGAVSNLDPSYYAESVFDETRPQDKVRDALSTGLLKGALERGLPVLAICRGFQELNVVLGGTLWQKLHVQGPFNDHRAGEQDPVEVQYGPSHEVHLEPNSVLATLTQKSRLTVNSLHEQAIKQLGDGLEVEARSPDGLIEAFRLAQYKGRPYSGFCLGVQWHPEWLAASNPDSIAIFKAFGEACRQYQKFSSLSSSSFPNQKERA